MTAGISSATEVNALKPSLAVITRICSRCNVIWTILRTVGLSSTTNTVGSLIYINLLRVSEDQRGFALLPLPRSLSGIFFQFDIISICDECIGSHLVF